MQKNKREKVITATTTELEPYWGARRRSSSKCSSQRHTPVRRFILHTIDDETLDIVYRWRQSTLLSFVVFVFLFFFLSTPAARPLLSRMDVAKENNSPTREKTWKKFYDAAVALAVTNSVDT